ncbi:MAG: hypothetical protein WBJ10_11065 [Daejeonella sp.]|uniref:hypothetical protein n=1 Tax=Daejeonella sp. TaxID=2805397 RepID=UPI003C7457F1
MKNLFKLFSLFLVFSLLAASCNSSNTVETDTDTTSLIDSMPVDTSETGDTAIVVDSIQ